MGHIAKFCKEKPGNQTAASQFENSSGSEVSKQIVSERRTTLKLQVGKQELDFLYDSGSQHSIIPRKVYDQLAIRPPLSPVNVSGICVAGNKFCIDRVAYLNLKLITANGIIYTLEYEPILFMAAVDTCIFGIRTEMRLNETRRSQDKMTSTFVNPESQAITIAYYREVNSKSSHAFIKVAKNAIIQVGVTWLKGKVQNYSAVRNTDAEFMFAGDLLCFSPQQTYTNEIKTVYYTFSNI